MYYIEQLETDIDNAKLKYPGISEVLLKLKNIENMSNIEYDYAIEKEHLRYKCLSEYLEKLINN